MIVRSPLGVTDGSDSRAVAFDGVTERLGIYSALVT